MARSVAINTTRDDKTTNVRVLIRPMLRVSLGTGPALALAALQSVACTLNGKSVLSLDAGQHFGEDGFFEFTLNGGTPGDTIDVAWTDASGGAGRGSARLK
jgi:hypothetical protein